jgi:hypothetical protein
MEGEMTASTVAAEGIGARLYQTVSDYATLAEHHRSGTPEGAATIDWFAAELRQRGARVELQEYTFPRFDASWEVRIDGERVASIPYFYAGSGGVRTDRPFTGTLPVRPPAEMPQEYADLEARAIAAGATATVTATLSESGELFAHNSAVREPGMMPHLGVAGRLAERLADARLEVDFDARIVEGRSANVIGRMGQGDPDATVLLTTPISGWFRSAGERGTGIALLLAVAEALAAEAPVLVVGTGNHELSHDGLHVYRRSGVPVCRGIIHFGGSSAIAIPNPDGNGVVLNPRFRVAGWIGDVRRHELERIYAPLERTIRTPADAEHRTWPVWQGEATEWAKLGIPLVSHSGRGPYTHTDHDLAPLATAPSVLAAVYAADLEMARFMAGPTDAWPVAQSW